MCRSGEIGRRSGLKIHRALAHAGSIPAFGTIIIKENKVVFVQQALLINIDSG